MACRGEGAVLENTLPARYQTSTIHYVTGNRISGPYIGLMGRRLPPSAYAVAAPSGTARRPQVNPFGTPRLREWHLPEGGTEEGLGGAQIQHQFARKFRAAINEDESGSIAEFARRHPQFSYERLRAILTGDAWMRLEDVAALTRLLGLELRINLSPKVGDIDGS